MNPGTAPSWWLYRGTGTPINPAERDRRWPAAPPWRTFSGGPDQPPPRPDDEAAARVLGGAEGGWVAAPEEILRVNTALQLRRPLLVSGEPGSGKSALAHRVARELRLGPVLHWRISGGSTLADGLYRVSGTGPERTVRLGPLGTALLPHRIPRVLLVDDLDRGGFDLPQELLDTLEDGAFVIPELLSPADDVDGALVHTWDSEATASVRNAVVRCHELPFVVATTGGEHDLPPAFVRHCTCLHLPPMTQESLAALARARFPAVADAHHGRVFDALLERAVRDPGGGPVLQRLLDALHLVNAGAPEGTWEGEEGEAAIDAIWRWAAVEGP